MDSNYIPNFKTAFQHFLVHTGGRAVIEEVEKKLSLAPGDVQPSKETLFRYGNTCCAAVFYVLTNMEARVRARRPDPTLPYSLLRRRLLCAEQHGGARARGPRAAALLAAVLQRRSGGADRPPAQARSGAAGQAVARKQASLFTARMWTAPRRAQPAEGGGAPSMCWVWMGLPASMLTACLLLQGMPAQAALLCSILVFCCPAAVQAR